MSRDIFNEINRNQSERNERSTKRARKELKRTRDTQEIVKIGIFGGILGVGCVVGCLAFARPSVSNLEKRNLTEKPKFTVASLADGTYLSSLQTWYADTFPGREVLLRANAGITNLYGLKTDTVHGDIQTADVIPTVPTKPTNQQTDPAQSAEATPEETASIAPSTENTVEETLETEPVATPVPETTPSVPQSSEMDSNVNTSQPSGGGSSFEQSYGAVYVQGERAFGLFYFNLNAANTYIETVNRMQTRVGGNTTVYCLLAPSSTEFYMKDSVKQSLGISSETDTFNYIYGSLGDGVRVVSVIETLNNHLGEYIYFNTDHHWTALGAYYAYQQFCNAKGITAASLGSFEQREYSGFLGSFYTHTLADSLKNNPDTVYAYVPKGTNKILATQQDGSPLSWYIVNDVSQYNAYNKYSTFIAGDNPYSIIENPAVTDGSSCLVIKESYGNAFVPFIVDHYQTVHIIDYRYYNGDIAEFVKANGVNDVIFLNNADAIGDSAGTQQLSSKIK